MFLCFDGQRSKHKNIIKHISKFLNMEAKINVELLKVTARKYDFAGVDGKQITGTSYKATLLSPEGEIFVVKTDDSVFKDTQSLKGKQEGLATIRITTNEIDGKIKLFLVSFDWK